MPGVAKRFSNLPTRWKLLLSFSLIIAALLLVIGMTLSAFRANRATMADLQSTQLANAIELLTLESQLNDNRIKVYKMLVAREDDVRVLRRELFEGSEKNRGLLKPSTF